MEQRRREQEHHEKQQELQQLKNKDKSQQSESVIQKLHACTHTQIHTHFIEPFSSVSQGCLLLVKYNLTGGATTAELNIALNIGTSHWVNIDSNTFCHLFVHTCTNIHTQNKWPNHASDFGAPYSRKVDTELLAAIFTYLTSNHF